MGAMSHGVKYVEQLADAGLLGPDLLFAHASGLTDGELDRIADAGAAIAVTPESELQTGCGFPITGRAIERSALVGIGVDAVLTRRGDMFGQMRIGLQTERALRNDALERRGLFPREPWPEAGRILELATLEGARAAGLDAKLGSLTPGKQADIALIRCDHLSLRPIEDPAHSVVLQANASDVDTVLVAGTPRKRGGQLAEELQELALLTRTLNKRGHKLSITTRLLIQGSCGIAQPFGNEEKLRVYLQDGSIGKLRRRLEADAKSLHAFHQYGRTHGSVRLRWGFLNERIPAPWVHWDEPVLWNLKQEPDGWHSWLVDDDDGWMLAEAASATASRRSGRLAGLNAARSLQVPRAKGVRHRVSADVRRPPRAPRAARASRLQSRAASGRTRSCLQREARARPM